MNAINVNPQSESALKAYAALQFPGSIDNFGTKTPIHLLMQQADSEHNLVLTDACDSDCDLDGAQFDYLGTIYDTVSELVKDRLGLKTDEDVAMFNKNNPTPFVSYEKLFGSPVLAERVTEENRETYFAFAKEVVDSYFGEAMQNGRLL